MASCAIRSLFPVYLMNVITVMLIHLLWCNLSTITHEHCTHRIIELTYFKMFACLILKERDVGSGI